jgi:hypothetical protein
LLNLKPACKFAYRQKDCFLPQKSFTGQNAPKKREQNGPIRNALSFYAGEVFALQK